METQARRRGESRLTARQRQVLQYRLDGKTNKEIATIMGISENTVKTHVSAGLTALGFLGEDREFETLKDEIKARINAYGPVAPDESTTEPPSGQPNSQSGPTNQPNRRMADTIVFNPAPFPWFRFILLGMGIGAVILLALELFLLQSSGRDPTMIFSASPTPGPTSTSVVERRVEMIEVTREIEVTRQVEVTVPVPQTVEVRVPQYVTVTQIVEVTPSPFTVTESNLPQGETPPLAATATPTVVGLGPPLPFRDDFQSLRSEWTVLRGERQLVEGQLTAGTDDVMLQLGNSQLTDYTVEFNLTPGYFHTVFIYIGPHFRYQHLFDGNLLCSWQLQQNGGWVDRAPGKICPYGSFRVRIQVSGDTYTITSGDRRYPLTDEVAKEHGPFAISLTKGTYLDNFTLTVP